MFDRQSLQHDSRGATMLEAAMSILFIMLLIGAVIDFGLGLWQYNYLNYTTTRSAREISAKLAVTGRCNEITSYLSTTAKKEMAMSSGAAVTWNWCTVAVGGDDCLLPSAPEVSKSLRLTGQLPLNCYFLCSVVPKNWTITATSGAAIENPGAPICSGTAS